MCSFWVQHAKGPSSLGEVILTTVHWYSMGQAQLYKIISSLRSHHVHSDINHIRWNKPHSQDQSQEDRMYILPTRSANKHILCRGKEDPLQHVYIFAKLFLHVTALLEWSSYRVVHRRLWRTPKMQWCLLLWMMGNPLPFPSLNPSAQICPVRFESIPLSVTDSACYHVSTQILVMEIVKNAFTWKTVT